MRKKRLLQLTAALLCAVILSACGGAPADADYTCTVSISCATILDNMDQCAESKKELVPADGVILPPTEVAFAEGESAFDVLQRVCRDNGIHLESKFTPVYNSAYIQGIHNIYEFDVGKLSGWMYAVNDWFPNYGCSLYQVQDGDVIRWVYTCDLGGRGRRSGRRGRTAGGSKHMNNGTLSHVDKSYTTYSTDIVLTGQERQSRTRQVLRDLSVTLPEGQITVIVGRSGCGKSTLLKLLAGKEQPDAGTISIPEDWHSAMLSPDPYVITWTSVQRNVAMACGVGKTPEERYEHAAEFVRMVGLEDYADLTPVELSTGMKQRLGLARVLAGQAQLLLMDEPFAALDFLTRAELQTQLLTIQQRLPRTIVLVTHQLEEALLLGQKIVVMHPDSTICEFDLTDMPYPRDPDSPRLRQLKEQITAQCRMATAN